MMRYLTLDMIKKQCRIESEFDEDDVLLEALGEGAEDFLEQHLNTPLDDIVAQNGGVLPGNLHAALLILTDYMYDNPGSGDTQDIPLAFFILVKPWMRYTVA